MIFKVLYQESQATAPVREHTKSLYLEAESERDVRSKLEDRNYNIELVQELKGAHLDYEKNSEDFKIERIS